jgi:hypothetical protein
LPDDTSIRRRGGNRINSASEFDLSAFGPRSGESRNRVLLTQHKTKIGMGDGGRRIESKGLAQFLDCLG